MPVLKRACLVLLLFACDDGGTDPVDMGAPDGPAATVEPAFEVGAEGALLSVWGPTDDAVYTVGGQPELGKAWRFDGAAWAPVEIPDGPLLNWVHGAGDHVWFVGDGGRALRSTGGAFEVFDTTVTESLWGVFASAPDDVWAVGGDATCGDQFDPIIVHFDGAAWSRVDIPPTDRDFCALFKVWGAAPDQVWAVGAKGVVLRWDGSAWAQVSAGTGQDLISLWGRSADDIMAVGGRGNGVTARWNGSAWTTTLLEREQGLNGVWMGADGVSWAVGNGGTLLRIEPDDARSKLSTRTRLVLHGVFGLPRGAAIAVGGSLLNSPPWDGVALEVTP